MTVKSRGVSCQPTNRKAYDWEWAKISYLRLASPDNLARELTVINSLILNFPLIPKHYHLKFTLTMDDRNYGSLVVVNSGWAFGWEEHKYWLWDLQLSGVVGDTKWLRSLVEKKNRTASWTSSFSPNTSRFPGVCDSCVGSVSGCSASLDVGWEI